MKIVDYKGLDEWRKTSMVKQNEEEPFKEEYECYRKASEILDKVIQHFETMKKTKVIQVIEECEKLLGKHLAFPISIQHPSYISCYEPTCDEEWKDEIPYHINMSAKYNDYIVEKSWTLKFNLLDDLLEKAIERITPDASIKDWSSWIEEELSKNKLYPIRGQGGYELKKGKIGDVLLLNEKIDKEEKFKENSVYSVKIICKTGNYKPIPLQKLTRCYSITDHRSNLKLNSAKTIQYQMKDRKNFTFYQRHIKHIYGYELGLKELVKKNVLIEMPVMFLPQSHCLEVGKTVMLRPTCKIIL